MVKIRLRLLD